MFLQNCPQVEGVDFVSRVRREECYTADYVGYIFPYLITVLFPCRLDCMVKLSFGFRKCPYAIFHYKTLALY